MVPEKRCQRVKLLQIAEKDLCDGKSSTGSPVCGSNTCTVCLLQQCSRNGSNQRNLSRHPFQCGYSHCKGCVTDIEVMLSYFAGAERVYIACGYTDMRCVIDGLAPLIQQQFSLEPLTNTLFLFFGRCWDRIKALYWEGNGFVLLYKRLESGGF